jgi:hypothetical protein
MTIMIGDHISIWVPQGDWHDGTPGLDGQPTFRWRHEYRITGYLESVLTFEDAAFLRIWERNAWGHYSQTFWKLGPDDSVENHSRPIQYESAAAMGATETFELRRHKVRP